MIKENRIKKRYTQEQLAEIMDITPRQIQRIENDEDKTKLTTMKKLIKILQIPDDEILKFMKH